MTCVLEEHSCQLGDFNCSNVGILQLLILNVSLSLFYIEIANLFNAL